MKFIVEAQLPYGIKLLINSKGYDAVHTDDLEKGERTSDHEINRISIKEQRVVITKDRDFLDSHLLRNQPKNLLLITTGNIKNKVLFELIRVNFSSLINLFEHYHFVQLSTEGISGQ